MHLLCGLVLAPLLVACASGSGSGAVSQVPPTGATPPPATYPWRGHFVGVVTIAEQEYFADAIVTVDGAIRLYIGGPGHDDGALQQTRAESSEQFIGTLQVDGDRGTAGGIVIAQGCSAGLVVAPFCAQDIQADLHVSIDTDGRMSGRLELSANDTPTTWIVMLHSWTLNDRDSAVLASVTGQFQEGVAEFALDGDTVLNVDASGAISFQSAHSGCIGTGTIAPHLDGAQDVFDVALTLENCTGAYAYLNGAFDGLATTTTSTKWDYDSEVRVWVSKSTPSAAYPYPVGLTLLGAPIY